MKKSFPIILLSSSLLLLSSCNLIPGKKGGDDSSGSITDSSSASTSTSASSSSSSSSKDVSTHCEIVTCGGVLPGSEVSWGIGDTAESKQMFLDYINSAAGLDIVSDYNDLANCYIQNHSNDSKEDRHLQIGTGKYRGKLFLRMTKQIKKVAVTFSAYYKENSEVSNIETNAKLYIEDELFLPDISATNPQTTKRVEYTYETPSEIVKFSNDDEKQRVYIDLIEFYY